MKVSVIIPIYNTEKYLRRCIDSVLNQTFDDYEILLIDDGSTDNCAAICDEYNHEIKVRVIHKSHGGVSSACNAGIDNASGKYLMFCDSDDYVEREWIATLYKAIEENLDSFVFCAFFKENNKESKLTRLSEGELYQHYTNNEYYFMYRKGFSAYRWNRIYIREKVSGNLRFDENVSVGEDVLFNIEYFKTCDSFLYVDKPLYHWVNNENDSLSRVYHAKYYDDIKKLYFPRVSVIADTNLQDFYNEYFYRFYACIDVFNDERNTMIDKDKKEYIRYILHDKAFCHAMEHAEKTRLKMILQFKSYLLLRIYKKLRD